MVFIVESLQQYFEDFFYTMFIGVFTHELLMTCFGYLFPFIVMLEIVFCFFNHFIESLVSDQMFTVFEQIL